MAERGGAQNGIDSISGPVYARQASGASLFEDSPHWSLVLT